MLSRRTLIAVTAAVCAVAASCLLNESPPHPGAIRAAVTSAKKFLFVFMMLSSLSTDVQGRRLASGLTDLRRASPL